MSLWRQIGETIVKDIDRGVFPAGERLPASADLASRFGVNQHTVLRAISHLEDEGLVRIERGRGAFVVESPISYRLGARTRFEQNLIELNLAPARQLIAALPLRASDRVASELRLNQGDPVTMIALVGHADEVPISYGLNYFPGWIAPDIIAIFRELAGGPSEKFSIAEALRQVGVQEFRRSKIRLRGRQPGTDETRYLRISSSESVLELLVTNVDNRDRPVMYASTSFSSSRVELVFDAS